MEKVLDHIGIAVLDIHEAILNLAALFGEPDQIQFESLEEQELKVAFLELGGLQVELLEATNTDGPVSKFIGKRGPGIHHVAWKVENITQTFQECLNAGLQVLSEKPYKGARDKWVFFIHPKDASGVLVEFCSTLKV